jgi:hypothetical protein
MKNRNTRRAQSAFSSASMAVAACGGVFAWCILYVACGQALDRRGLSSSASATTSALVWTNRYDNQRTGVNGNETQLTPANVSSGNFGLLFSRSVDGQIYSQPLVVPGMTINGSVHDVVFVATEHNSVYAFDATGTDLGAATPLWHVSLGASAPLVVGKQVRCGDMFPEQGITATPVIDIKTGTLYVSHVTVVNGTYFQKLHALDIYTGNEKFGGPVNITGSGFDPKIHLNRAGLLLDNGTVYIAYSSNCDQYAYHGWVFAYDAATLARRGVYNDTPGGSQGGIWMSGIGMSSDGSGVYFAAGNGDFDSNNGGAQTGESVVRLQLTSSGLSVADWYTPSDADALNSKDADLTGAVIVPGTNWILSGSKAGVLFVVDRTNMGHYQADSDPAQRLNVGGHVHGGPVVWTGPTGQVAYVWSENSPVMQFAVSSSGLQVTGVQGKVITSAGHPGGMTTISANGMQNGIVWGAYSPSGDGWHSLVPGNLVAFDAKDLHTLWRSDAKSRDALGTFAKFAPPVVANGRVYMATNSNAMRVYGLLTPPPPPPDLAVPPPPPDLAAPPPADLSGPPAADLSESPPPFSEKINFQLGSAPVPAGYLPDDGSVFAPHAGGLSYGWSADNTGAARWRQSSRSSDLRYDTTVLFQKFGDYSWEIAVPNGTYKIHLVAGDANYFDSVYDITAEGTTVLGGTPTSANRWIEASATVTVSDGRLTLDNGPTAQNNKICFIDIDQQH